MFRIQGPYTDIVWLGELKLLTRWLSFPYDISCCMFWGQKYLFVCSFNSFIIKHWLLSSYSWHKQMFPNKSKFVSLLNHNHWLLLLRYMQIQQIHNSVYIFLTALAVLSIPGTRMATDASILVSVYLGHFKLYINIDKKNWSVPF